MNHDYESTPFSKAVLAGVFAGILATIAIIVFDSIYRGATAYPLSQIINVSTIIFSSLILMIIAGVLYYSFNHYFKQGTLLYILLFSVLTILAGIGIWNVDRSDIALFNLEFHQLVFGVILILGLCAVVGIPALYRSKQI